MAVHLLRMQLSGFEQGTSQVFHRRLVEVSSRMVLLAVLGASLGLSACSGTVELSDRARFALEAYWESLPSHPAVENRIVRAWPGEATLQLPVYAAQPTSLTASTDGPLASFQTVLICCALRDLEPIALLRL
jgi:hypothetical protein